jgi:hypothetical protein
LTTGATYRISGTLKNGTAPSVKLVVTSNTDFTEAFSQTVTATDWTSVSGQFVAPASASGWLIQVVCTGAGTAQADNVTLRLVQVESVAIPSGLAAYTGNVIADSDTFETYLGRSAALHTVFFDQSSWTNFSNGVASITSTHANRRNIWSVPLVPTGGTFADVTGGSKDSLFQTVASSILTAEPGTHGIVIRTGWEMNLASQPWNAISDQAGFIAAFRRVVGLFRAASNRFKFDWCPNVETQGVDPVLCYPGDDVVDIISQDVYFTSQFDATGDAGAGVFGFRRDQARGLQWCVTFAAAHGKALGMTEWGVNSNLATSYMQSLCQWIVSNNYQYHGYWDGAHGGASCRLDNGDNPALAAIYKQYFGLPVITSSNAFTAAQNVDYQIPLTSNQDSIYSITWSIVSGPGSIVGNTLTIPGTTGSSSTIVKATNSKGLSSAQQTIAVTWQAPYSFTNTEASAYVARMTTAPTETRKQVIDTFFTSIKPFLSKLESVHLRAAHTEQAALLNLVKDAGSGAYGSGSDTYTNTTKVNAPTFTVDRGFAGNNSGGASPGYLSLGIPTNRSGGYAQNSGSLGVYCLTSTGDNSPVMGRANSSAQINPRNSSNQAQVSVNDFSNLSVANTDGKGFYAAIRSGSAARALYMGTGSTAAGSDTTASGQGDGADVMVELTQNVSFPSSRQIAFSFTGTGTLTGAEISTLATAVTTYLTAVGAI